MSNKTNLDPERREQVDLWFAAELESGVESSRSALARAVWSSLVAAAEGGDDDASRLLFDLALDGLEERAYTFLKSDTGVIVVPTDDGRSSPVRTPTRVGIKRRRGDGSVSHQLRLWWEVTWEEYAAWRDAMLALERKIAAKRGAFARVDALYERYPETRTPGEACERAGIDPRDLGLGEVTA